MCVFLRFSNFIFKIPRCYKSLRNGILVTGIMIKQAMRRKGKKGKENKRRKREVLVAGIMIKQAHVKISMWDGGRNPQIHFWISCDNCVFLQ
jgi:hypothetical protein